MISAGPRRPGGGCGLVIVAAVAYSALFGKPVTGASIDQARSLGAAAAGWGEQANRASFSLVENAFGPRANRGRPEWYGVQMKP